MTIKAQSSHVYVVVQRQPHDHAAVGMATEIAGVYSTMALASEAANGLAPGWDITVYEWHVDSAEYYAVDIRRPMS